MANGGASSAAADAALALETGSDRWIALLTTLPTTNTGTGLVEVSGGSYARVKITATTGWNAPTTLADNLTRQATTTALAAWAQASANWGTILGWALYDAATAGNFRRWGVLVDGSGNPTSQAVNTGTTFEFPAGGFALQQA